MDYVAGNLELNIIGYDTSVVERIDATAKALRRLANATTKLNSLQLSQTGNSLADLFTRISKATKSIDTQSITTLASAAKSISSITKIGKLENVDYEKIGNGFSNLTIAVTPFVNKIKEAEASLVSLDGILKRSSSKKMQSLLGEGGKKSGSLFGLAKIGITIRSIRRLANFAADLVQAGSDYNETLNLWQVSMRENLATAEKFVDKMQKAYGISTKTAMEMQAVFKNMVGSLGQISNAAAYDVSEALALMVADYASLYNRTIKSASENMQSMLAGQVRPIRSAGLDITETTLYMFYQQIGGTKTMRQLNRTEKQLLSILAVYKQMGTAGALGDMNKTLNLFANQSRMLSQYWQELKTWSGLLLKDLLDDGEVLVTINAMLLTASEIVKAIAKSRGIGEEDYISGLLQTTEATNDEVDELQGKLLDFDKFRSLDGGASQSLVSVDEKLLDAISGYTSIIDQAENKAQQLAETWLTNLGFVDANGDGVLDITYRAEELLVTLKSIAQTLGIIAAVKISSKIWLAVSAVEGATFATKMFHLASTAALYGGIFLILYALNDLTQNWDKMSTAMKVAKIAILGIGFALTTYSILSKLAAKDTTLLTTAFTLQRIAAIGLAVGGIGLLIANISLLVGSWDKMKTWEKVVGVFGAVGAAALAAAAAIAAFQGSWSLGTATVAIVGALAAITAAFVSFKANTKELAVPMYATGASNIDGGTLFVAGDMGKTEAVYTGSNGKTNVANIQQMKAAYTQALNEWWRSAKHDIPEFQGVSESGLYTVVSNEATRHGKKFVNV